MRRQPSNLRRSSLYRRKSSSVIAVLNWSATDNHLETDLARIIGCPEAIQQGGAKKLAGLVTGSQLAGRDLRSMITIYDCRQHSMSWVGYGEDIPANWIGMLTVSVVTVHSQALVGFPLTLLLQSGIR